MTLTLGTRYDRHNVFGGEFSPRLTQCGGDALLHLGGSYQISRKPSLNAAIYNLLGRDFVDNQPYRSAASAAPSYGNRFANSPEGRRLWLAVNADF